MSRIYTHFPKRIFIFSLLLFVFVTFLLILSNFYYIRNEIILETQHHAKIIAEHLSYELFDVYGLTMDEISSESSEDFNNHFLRESKPLGVESIKIYNASGTIVFSNDFSIVGMKVKKNENFENALKNKITSNIASSAYLRRVYNVEIDKDMVESYLPIYDENKKNIIGVYEIYQDYAPVKKAIADAMKRTALIIVSLMFCFSVILFSLIRRGNIIIASEKERLVKELEDKVEKRTKELSESEEKYRTFLENVTDSVVVIDSKGSFVLANDKLFETLGYTSEEIYNMNFKDILEKSYDNISKAKEEFKSVLEGNSVSFELSLTRKNGDVVPMEIVAKKINYDSQEMIMGTGRDITERRELEEMQNDFYSMLSHDFRVPLTPILGFAEVILEERWGKIDNKTKEMIRTISRNASRLNKLIDDFLLSSKIDSESLVLNMHEYNINNFIDEIIGNYEPNLTSKRIKLIRNLSKEKLMLRGDITQMERVISNLLSNAIKYNNSGGIIKINTVKLKHYKEGVGVKVDIFNSYGTINKKDLPMIFEKYKRSDRMHKIEGTGLGLYIVKSIINLHGGEVMVQSREGIGTTFTIKLPLIGTIASG